MSLNTKEGRWSMNQTKRIIEFSEFQSIRGVHGKIYCTSGPEVGIHVDSLSHISEQGKQPIVLVEKDKDEYEKMIKKVNARKNVTLEHSLALNMYMGDGHFIDLDLMSTMIECATTLSVKLYEQSNNTTHKKAFGFTVSCRRNDMSKTFRGINTIIEIIGAKLKGFDNKKNRWKYCHEIKGNRRVPNFEIKGRITRIMPITTNAIPTNVKKSNRWDMLFKR